MFARPIGLAALALAATIAMPGQAAAYTCWNPAICIAVCGSKTCGDEAKAQVRGKLAFSAPEMKRELGRAPKRGAVAQAINATLSADAKRSKSYTCWNPAICIAVCGKKTC